MLLIKVAQTAKLLDHSLSHHPKNIVFSDQKSYEVNLIRNSKEHRDLVDRLITNAKKTMKR